MESKMITLLIIIGFSVIYSAEAADECKTAVNKMLEAQLKGLTDCIKKLNLVDTKERAEKMSCVLRCVLSGIIGEDGLLDPVAALALVEKHVPENLREKATMLMMECQEAAANIDPTEELCHSYDAVIRCAMGAMNKFCL